MNIELSQDSIHHPGSPVAWSQSLIGYKTGVYPSKDAIVSQCTNTHTYSHKITYYGKFSDKNKPNCMSLDWVSGGGLKNKGQAC